MSVVTIRVEVVYAVSGSERVYPVMVGTGATLIEAIRASGVLDDCAEIDLAINRVGIWGRLQPLDAPLRDGDRVEIYSALRADPKETRRRRGAARGRKPR